MAVAVKNKKRKRKAKTRSNGVIPVTEDLKIIKEHPALITKGVPPVTLPPTTTEQEDLVTLGQRTINLIWEKTQSQIAKVSIYGGLFTNIFVVILLVIYRREISETIIVVVLSCLSSLNGIMGIIIGFYFSRTNHSAIGGTGKKEKASEVGTR